MASSGRLEQRVLVTGDSTLAAVAASMGYDAYGAADLQVPDLVLASLILVDVCSLGADLAAVRDAVSLATRRKGTLIWLGDESCAGSIAEISGGQTMALKRPLGAEMLEATAAISKEVLASMTASRLLLETPNGWKSLVTLKDSDGMACAIFRIQGDRRELVLASRGGGLELLSGLDGLLLSPRLSAIPIWVAGRWLVAATLLFVLTLGVREWQRGENQKNIGSISESFSSLGVDDEMPALAVISAVPVEVLEDLSRPTGARKSPPEARLILAARLMLDAQEEEAYRELLELPEKERAAQLGSYLDALERGFDRSLSILRMEAARYRATRLIQVAESVPYWWEGRERLTNRVHRFLSLLGGSYPFDDVEVSNLVVQDFLVDSWIRPDWGMVWTRALPDPSQIHDRILREAVTYQSKVAEIGGRESEDQAMKWLRAGEVLTRPEARQLADFNALVAMANSGLAIQFSESRGAPVESESFGAAFCSAALDFSRVHPRSYLADDALVLGIRFGLQDAIEPFRMVKSMYSSGDMLKRARAELDRRLEQLEASPSEQASKCLEKSLDDATERACAEWFGRLMTPGAA